MATGSTVKGSAATSSTSNPSLMWIDLRPSSGESGVPGLTGESALAAHAVPITTHSACKRAAPIGLVIAVKWFIPFYRRSGYVSAYQHLEHRFGPWARTYAVVCCLLIMMARMGATLYLLALALAPMLGWDIRLIIVITGLLITLYTTIGGSEGVIWTDTVHNIVLIAGVVVCVAIEL